MNSSYTIALDLDGVLADFEGKCQQILRQPIPSLPKGKVWQSIQHYNDNVEPFFESLEKLPDADELFNFVKSNFTNYFILSACGFTPKDGADQKRRWVKRHYGNVVAKIVTKSPDKAQFANDYTILVDDRSKSIDPWVAAGGIGVLHTSAKESIELIRKITGV